MILKNVEKKIFDICLKQCERLTLLSLNKIDTSNVKYVNSIFENCNKLNYLDIYSFDTSIVINNVKIIERL